MFVVRCWRCVLSWSDGCVFVVLVVVCCCVLCVVRVVNVVDSCKLYVVVVWLC